MSNPSLIFAAMTNGLRLGLGGAPLGNLFRAIPEEEAGDLLQTALADGCRSFDTAPHYGHGLSEHRLGQSLRLWPRDQLSVSTKVGRILVPDENTPRAQNGYVDILPFRQHWDYSARGVRRSIEDSLQRLGVGRLNAVFIHDCDRDNHADRYDAVVAQVASEAIPELQRMKHEGLISAIGLGVNDTQVCLDVLARADLDCLLLAGRYTLIDQKGLPELLPLCERRGIRIAIGGVFNSGILATGVGQSAERPLFNYGPAGEHWIERVRRIETLCAEFAIPLRAAALQFPLAHPAVEIVMVGAHHRDQWSDANEMIRHPIPGAFWAALKQASLLPSDAPIPEGVS
jgi:D-threo-aldose 1-dehydrogenase